jgi:eukaryotic translation initiation factor 2C
MVLFQLSLVGFNDDPCVKEFGLSVSDRFEKVEARILDAPQLEYNLQVVSKYFRIL